MKQPRYEVDPATGCWNWLLYVNTYGYGWVNVGGRSRHAHIYEWEKTNGRVPNGLMLDHKCRNRRCINPDHLETVTNTENVRRGNACKLNKTSVATIRERVASGETRAAVAKEFGVDASQITRVVKGERWIDEIKDPLLTVRVKSSIHPGVTYHKAANKWMAHASHERQTVYLGLHNSEAEALGAVTKYKGEHHVSNSDAPAIEVGIVRADQAEV